MADRKGPVGAVHLTKERNFPPVGFIARTDNTDALVRAVVRARRYGHPCLVTYTGENPPEGALLAEYLGATIVTPQTTNPNTDRLEQLLAGVAQVQGSGPFILAPTDCVPIDYHRTLATLEESSETRTRAITRSDSRSRRRPDVLLAIPAYNEAETIGSVVRESEPYADAVLVVDDGSEDETATVAREAGAEVVSHRYNRGYGGALKTAFAAARDRKARSLVVLDGDGQHDPADVPRLVDRLDEPGVEVVIGSRFVADGGADLPLYRLFGAKVINVLTNLSMGVVRGRSRVRDTQSGFRAYGPEAIESLAEDRVISDDMGASTNILHHAYRYDYGIEEVGTTISYDVDNANSQDPIRHGLTLVGNIVQTIEREHPIMTLGIPGVGLTLCGFLLGYWSFVDYVTTEQISLGIVVGTVFFGLLGILACFTALILHSLTVHFSTEPRRGP